MAIKALDELTISKIAAGEVVERPVSVVKELVENSLDACSARISVEVEDGGRKLIRVSDDGAGMGAEDAALCLKSHTTSKLGSVDDLDRISTLGFRGEALHSIGAVSRLTLTTCDNDNGEGVRVRMEGGIEQPAEPAPRARGTTIEVENLFYNVPARRKFLKSARSEIQAVDMLISRLIVACPAAGFLLSHNGREVFKVPAESDIADRFRYIFGKDIAARIVRAGGRRGGMSLDAFFTMPDISFPNRRYQIFMVNGRLVKDRHLSVAVDTAYKGLMPGNRFGLAMLFLDVPASEIDANVHPSKSEVRFLMSHEIHSLVYHTLRGRFTDTGLPEAGEVFSLTPQVSPGAGAGRKPGDPAQSGLKPPATQSELRIPDEPPGVLPLSKKQPEGGSSVIKPGTPGTGGDSATAPERQVDIRQPSESRITGRDFKVLGQFFKTYILIDLDGRPVFIDQHVASERIFYNELKRKSVGAPEQLQLISEPVEVPRDVYNLLCENMERVRASGIEIEPFGERAFVIRAVAHHAGPFDPAELLVAVAAEIRSTPYKAAENVLTDRLLTVAACKLAVKAGQELSIEEMDSLVEKYLKEEFNRTCPHGRPIIHELAREALDVWFRR